MAAAQATKTGGQAAGWKTVRAGGVVETAAAVVAALMAAMGMRVTGTVRGRNGSRGRTAVETGAAAALEERLAGVMTQALLIMIVWRQP